MMQPSTFPTDLGIATRVGLTRGAGQFPAGTGSFAEAEMRYRQDRLIADLIRHRNADQAEAGHVAGAGHGVMSKWTTWLQSVPLLHRSSAAQPNSSACTN